MDNISGKDLKRFKLDAKKRFLLTDEEIKERLKERFFIEVTQED
jgi:hypothetical protein